MQLANMGDYGKSVPQPQKVNLYTQFILWSAMPPMEQQRLGIESLQAFADFYGIHVNTTYNWKHRPDFQDRVRKILRMWAFDKTPGVVQGIYRSAIKGNSDSQRIWLQYFEGWSEKQTIENTVKVVVSVGDIRYLIEGLPEPLRSKHYANLRELLDDTIAARDSGAIKDGDWTEKPALLVSGETDNDAQDVPDPTPSKVSCRHSQSVWQDLVGEVPANHHQSAAWWG